MDNVKPTPEDDEARIGRAQSVAWLYRKNDLRRAAMPKAERNDVDVGEGCRHKRALRYE